MTKGTTTKPINLKAITYSHVRIIGGKYKSRKIVFPKQDNNDLRPTSDRLRETVFNWLAPFIVDAKCLDAFAGSGALGFEALSRFAQSCCFFDINHKVTKTLQQNLQVLSINNATINQSNVIHHLTQNINYQIIFLDPPFKSKLLSQALRIILNNDSIDSNTLIYIEFPSTNPPIMLKSFEIIKQKKQGKICAYLIYKKPFSINR